MITVLASAPPVPLNTTGGHYVAAAYIVVLVLILAYVAIMAVRAQRLERELHELRRDVEAARAQDDEVAGAPADAPRVVAAGERRSP